MLPLCNQSCTAPRGRDMGITYKPNIRTMDDEKVVAEQPTPQESAPAAEDSAAPAPEAAPQQ